MTITRRQALLTGATLPIASFAMTASAAGHATSPEPTPITHRTFHLGDFEVTTLLAGSRPMDNPQGTFGMNASAEEFAAASAENFIPADRSVNFFTPTVVNTGSEVILFDTGLSADGITSALAGAGYSADDITHVVLTHMHGDHIGGLSGDAGVTFANAAYVTGQVEYDHWAAAGNEGFDAKVRPLAEKMTFLGDGGSVRSGITAVAAHGHTPGHMGYMLESNGSQLLLMADTTNHYVWSLQHPEWEVRFDMDKTAAAETRKRILGMAAADRIPVVGYHMPFPGLGYIDTRSENGFHFVPHSYQLL